MQGHGLGSLKYGGVSEQLVRLQVVLPSGEPVIVTRDSDPPLEWFAAAEGTLGVITEVELSVRPRPAAEVHHLFAMDGPGALGASVRELAHAEPRPFTVFFADGGYLRLLARGNFRLPLDLPPSLYLAGDQGLLLASYQGEPDEVRQGALALARLPGRELPSDQALDEWNLRLYHLRTRRAGPSLVAAEMWLPLAGLGRYLAQVRSMADRHHLLIGTYGFAVGPEWALTMSLLPTDERDPIKYLPALAFTHWLQDLGARCGGRPYGVGVFNMAYLPRLFNRARLKELRRRKARLDPLGIMNPGKLYRASFPFSPAAFAAGASLLGAAHLALGREQP
jgi:glycolate oxidase